MADSRVRENTDRLVLVGFAVGGRGIRLSL